MMRIAGYAGLALFLTTSAFAQQADGPVLKGPAAFGDWRADRPGVRRLIRAEDLPAPYVTKSASNAAGIAERPDGATPKLPEGFTAELVASGIDNPRVVRVAPNGDLFVADSEANQVRVYRLAEGGAKPVKSDIFAGDLNQPYGIAFYPPGDDPQWVYIANSDSVVRFAYRAGDLKATGRAETIIDNIPSNHHWTRDIVFSPDGKTLYLSVGSGSNVAEGMARKPQGGLDAWIKSKPLGASWGSEEGRA
ncbi:MAG: beta-propeller fold lactonase family protein, partial [Mesorhizobium sp.]|nr:beta-propeller fold lactonase family protein [Mesorhizobium sp.]